MSFREIQITEIQKQRSDKYGFCASTLPMAFLRGWKRRDSVLYAAIEKALSKVTDIDSLLDLYEQHKMEVDNDSSIRDMFSKKKQEIRQSTVITF